MEVLITKLLTENNTLHAKIIDLEKQLEISKQEQPYQSIETKDLAAALAKARLEFRNPAKNKIVAFSGRKYEYSDLAAITEAVAPALAKYGIALVQQVEDINGATILHTKLIHLSGQWIESRTRVIPNGKTHQEWGSALSYQRRYNIMALCAIAPEDEPSDDDALVADKKDIDKFTQGSVQSKINPRKDNYETVTPEQLDQLYDELANEVFNEDVEKIITNIQDKYQVHTLADLPKNRYKEVFDWVMVAKNTRRGLIKK